MGSDDWLLTAPVRMTGTISSGSSRRGVILKIKEVDTLKAKLAALWIRFLEHMQPHWAEIKGHGLAGLRMVVRNQAPVLWTKAQAQAQAAWQWVTVKGKAVPVSKQALVHLAVGLAAVSLWLAFKAVPGVMAAALSMTMVVAFFALIVAFLAFGGVAIVMPLLQPAAEAPG
jgi:hypothetical protein